MAKLNEEVVQKAFEYNDLKKARAALEFRNKRIDESVDILTKLGFEVRREEITFIEADETNVHDYNVKCGVQLDDDTFLYVFHVHSTTGQANIRVIERCYHDNERGTMTRIGGIQLYPTSEFMLKPLSWLTDDGRGVEILNETRVMMMQSLYPQKGK